MITETRAASPRLSADVVTGLWVLCLVDLTFGAWLLAVTHNAAACTGLLCTAATLGDHPTAALVLSQAAAALLVVLLPGDHATVGRVRGAGIAVAGLGGAIALAGVAVLIAGIAFALVVVTMIVIHIVDNL